MSTHIPSSLHSRQCLNGLAKTRACPSSAPDPSSHDKCSTGGQTHHGKRLVCKRKFRQEAGASHAHGTLNGTIDHEKDVPGVFFLVRRRLLQVEEPVQENIASLTHSSIAGECRSYLDKRRMARGEQTEKPS